MEFPIQREVAKGGLWRRRGAERLVLSGKSGCTTRQASDIILTGAIGTGNLLEGHGVFGFQVKKIDK